MSFLCRMFAGTFLAIALFASATTDALAGEKQKLVVFAAASMKNALDDANKAWVAKGNSEVTVSYAASSTLANQIDKGAPADIFISADRDWMNFLKEKQWINPETVFELLGNSLVLIVRNADLPTGEPAAISPKFDLPGKLASGKLAMGLVDSVPAGKYGKMALQKLGLWERVSGNIAQTDNVRAALLLVSRGEAAAGIVYATDAAADASVAVAGVFPADSHPTIVYPAAVAATSANPDSGAYLAFLRSPEAEVFFERQGFTFLPVAP